jgi:hypothetical protein
LSGVGGDAMVNPFLVNIKGNTDVNVANRFTMAIYNKLSYTNAINSNNRNAIIIKLGILILKDFFIVSTEIF